MNYYNSLCNGCGKPLREDEDIVVCPECGTPQHRECYKKDNRCVSSALHSSDFVWSPASDSFAPTVPAPVKEKSEKELLPCPSCGHLNSPDAKVCESCSMKLIVFGMNLAEAAQETGHKTPAQKELPDYPAPFVLGQGEGFDYDAHSPKVPDVEAAPEESPEIQAAKREQARQHLLLRFIGTNTDKYLDSFSRLEGGRRARFNFAAFFFSPYWFFYRKLYKPGIIFLTASFLHSLFFTPTVSEFYAFVEKYRPLVSQLATDEALAEAYLNELSAITPMFSVAIITSLALKIIAGFIAYPLYKRYTDTSIAAIMSAPSAQAGLSNAAKLGGTSFFAVFAAFLATEILSYMVSIMINGM